MAARPARLRLPVGIELSLLCCRNDRRAALQQRFGWSSTSADWRAAIDHALCEKPLTTSAADALALADMASRRFVDAGLVSMVGFNYRRLPAIHRARELIRNGELGSVRHVRASYLQDWALDPVRRRTWRIDASLSRFGVLGDLGSHLLDLISHLTGETLACTSATIATADDVSNDDTVFATLRVEVLGTSGGVAFELSSPQVLRVTRTGTSGWRTLRGPDLDDPWRERWMGNPNAYGVETATSTRRSTSSGRSLLGPRPPRASRLEPRSSRRSTRSTGWLPCHRWRRRHVGLPTPQPRRRQSDRHRNGVLRLVR